MRTIRSSSEFNFSMITIIFEDNVDFYFARQRVTERLDQAGSYLPAGVVPYLAPDATALGQIFWYTIEPGPRAPMDPERLWALNKFYVVRQLNAVPGVAEVATVGGMPQEYQVDIQPETLRAYGITLGELFAAVGRTNMPAAGGVIQKNNSEYIVRGIGWIQRQEDIEDALIKEVNGAPIYVKTVASVQIGTQYRRGVFEKNGSEVNGGVVLMRHGENPLRVTQRVKEKIQELQPGLPAGVQIVPAYDRTRLVRGAIGTLGEVMWHEMLIAAIAILLILGHVRSAFVICITLPLAVLFSFLLMWLLRKFGILDVQANIMSLAGITISIGVLVDQAIVMTENATHHLKRKFGNDRVTGDTRDIVLAACRTVGRPIFFSVLIMLLSFVPVFMLSATGPARCFIHWRSPKSLRPHRRRPGVGHRRARVAPQLSQGQAEKRGPELDRAQLHRHLSADAVVLPTARCNLIMWMFAALLILAAGIFPLQGLIGLMDQHVWRLMFLGTFAVVTGLTVWFTRGFPCQLLSLGTLAILGMWAYHFKPMGIDFVPTLDEGTTLDMPVSWPRTSITQAADDLKARDALIRGFPEVETVIGKAGRADTATDPSPLEMVETFVNFRPREFWPRRVLPYADAARQTRRVLADLEAKGLVMAAAQADDRDNVVNEAAQKAIERFDEVMLPKLASRRYRDFEREVQPVLTRFVVIESLRRMKHCVRLADDAGLVDELSAPLAIDFGPRLSTSPAPEVIANLQKNLASALHVRDLVGEPTTALQLRENDLDRAWNIAREAFGGNRRTLISIVFGLLEDERARLWKEQVKKTNFELADRGTETFTWYALEELARSAHSAALVAGAARGAETERFADESLKIQLGKEADMSVFAPFVAIREERERDFRDRVIFVQRAGGPQGDLVDDEMRRVLQVPGWSNIFTQPIINRMDMLSTGIRTQVGVKVFGDDLKTIRRVCEQVEEALKPINGARDVVVAQDLGKGYLEVTIDRERAGRQGLNVEDVQSEIQEMALGGRVVTYTVERRERYPVRIRYARAPSAKTRKRSSAC